jgi:hypothetical protein
MGNSANAKKEPMKFDSENRPSYRRPQAEILCDLRREIPASLLKTKTIKGTAITYIPWHKVVDILDWFAPGWSLEVRGIHGSGAQTIITMRLTIPAAEGDIHREATGIETEEVTGYGDTSSNASAMALRRCAAMFGVGKYLYNK